MLITLASLGCGQGSPTAATVVTPQTVPAPTAATPPKPPEPALSVNQVAADHAAGAATFDPKYKDKTVVVEGVVGTPDVVDDVGEHFLQLSGVQKPGEPAGGVVMCRFPDAGYEKAARLPSGSMVKVRGKVLGFSDQAPEARLTDCEFVDVQEAVVEPLDAEAVAVGEAQLAKEIEADAAAAAKKYLNKTLLVDGTVANTLASELYLKGGFDPATGKGVQVLARMALPAQEKAAALTVGQQVKVKGRCVSLAPELVMLTNTEVAEAGADPAVVVTAAELATAYAKDEAAADKQYKDKQLLVEGKVGEVAKLTAGKSALPLVVLEGADKLQVSAQFPTADVKQPAWALKPGQTVKIKGKCDGKRNGDVAISLPKVVK